MKIDTTKLKLKPVPSGFTIRIRHITDPKELVLHRPKRETVPPKRVTEAVLINKESGKPYVGAWANCSPNDQVNKKLGRIIAHNRCIRAFERLPNEFVAEAIQHEAETLNGVVDDTNAEGVHV